jgi:hypothetical protein
MAYDHLTLDQAQHLDELGKHQNFAVLAHQLFKDLHQTVTFGTVFDLGRGIELHQLRVTADLPELQESIKYSYTRPRQAFRVNGLSHTSIHRSADAFIEGSLRACKRDHFIDDGFGRKVDRHLVFGAAQLLDRAAIL